MPALTYYMDETGNRHPDKKSDASREGRDWFALGGYLIKQEDEGTARELHADICERWDIKQPFHMTDMLAAKKGFSWLGKLSDRNRTKFWEDYKNFLCAVPVLGTGCVISRPGYVRRGYLEKHGDSKWLLCRSAFDITLERAVKYAETLDRKLNVVFESDVSLNETVKGYFKNLKANGLDFDESNSAKYSPLTQERFCTTLGTIEYKNKSHKLLQIADSYIYAIARQKYERLFHIHNRLRDDKRIIDFGLEGDAAAIKAMGIKYYCFDK